MSLLLPKTNPTQHPFPQPTYPSPFPNKIHPTFFFLLSSQPPMLTISSTSLPPPSAKLQAPHHHPNLLPSLQHSTPLLLNSKQTTKQQKPSLPQTNCQTTCINLSRQKQFNSQDLSKAIQRPQTDVG